MKHALWLALPLFLVACSSDDTASPAGAAGAAGASAGAAGLSGSSGQSGSAQAGGSGGSGQAGSGQAGSGQAGSGQAGGGQAGSGVAGGGQAGSGVAGSGVAGGGGAGASGGFGQGGGASCDEKNCFLKCVCEGGGHEACVDACPGGPPGAKRVVLTSEEFEVEPGGEVYRCQNFQNPFGGEDVEVQATESFMSPGSHHLFAFYKNGAKDEPQEDCSGLEFSRWIHTAQSPYNLFSYPEGVAVRIKQSEGVRMQAHYINPTDKPLKARMTQVFYLADPTTVKQHSGQLFFNNLAVYVAPHSPAETSKTCTLPRDIKLFTMTSHMHQYGTLFKASTDDGAQIYETTSWSDAEFKVFSPAIDLKKGQQITFSCSYQNTSDKALTFGESAYTNEMCILSGRYFHDGDGEAIDCQ